MAYLLLVQIDVLILKLYPFKCQRKSTIALPSALRLSDLALDQSFHCARNLGIHLHSKQAICQMHTPDLHRLDKSSVFICLHELLKYFSQTMRLHTPSIVYMFHFFAVSEETTQFRCTPLFPAAWSTEQVSLHYRETLS